MTNQEKIKYLKQYKNLDDSINRLICEKERFASIAFKVTPTWSDMPKGSDGENPRELAICKMMDCEKEITEAIDDYVNLGNEIKSLIKKVDNDTLRLLLHYRYIDGKTFEEIAVAMSYTWRNIHYLHTKALNNLFIVFHI